MLQLSEGMLLYHGSYCEVKTPNLAKCADRKDFGRGFYLTSSKEQAENFIQTSLKKAKAQGIIEESQKYGVISVSGCGCRLAALCSRSQKRRHISGCC